jgi:hypothetical protein
VTVDLGDIGLLAVALEASAAPGREGVGVASLGRGFLFHPKHDGKHIGWSW